MEKIIHFILELDKLKLVERKVRLSGSGRFENTAEHTWHIAMLAASLAPFAIEPIDISRVIKMLLVHDIGEIDTGDTIVFAQTGWAEHKDAELRSAERIFGLLPEQAGDEFLQLWKEFEASESPDARFAHAADRAMPVLLNLVNQGGSWRENGITYDRVMKRVGPEINAGCPALWNYLSARLEEAKQLGWFGADR
jgi:putative hydrolase of HD superfamily